MLLPLEEEEAAAAKAEEEAARLKAEEEAAEAAKPGEVSDEGSVTVDIRLLGSMQDHAVRAATNPECLLCFAACGLTALHLCRLLHWLTDPLMCTGKS